MADERTSGTPTLDREMGAIVIAAAVGLVTGVAIAAMWLARRQGRTHDTLRAELRTARDELQEADGPDVRDLILSSMRDGVVLFDDRGVAVFANGAAATVFGTVPRDLDGLMPTGARDAARGAARDRTPASAIVGTGSPARWLQVTASPAGDDSAVLVTVRDVTTERRTDDIRRDFVTNASHELKTPAAAIQAAAETIRHASEEDLEAVPRFALQLEREAFRLSRIVADLLDLSRLEAGSDLSEVVDLDAIVRQQVEAHEDAAREAGLVLTSEAPGAAQVPGSTRDLSLLVRNLLDNAIRYSRPGGTVRVATSVDGRWVLLTVADDGVGIPTRDLPRVFERFYRVDRARSRETGGTGLGLAIVKHVAENHGGHVDAESELGRGTAFHVTLPLA